MPWRNAHTPREALGTGNTRSRRCHSIPRRLRWPDAALLGGGPPRAAQNCPLPRHHPCMPSSRKPPLPSRTGLGVTVLACPQSPVSQSQLSVNFRPAAPISADSANGGPEAWPASRPRAAGTGRSAHQVAERGLTARADGGTARAAGGVPRDEHRTSQSRLEEASGRDAGLGLAGYRDTLPLGRQGPGQQGSCPTPCPGPKAPRPGCLQGARLLWAHWHCPRRETGR